MFITDNPQFPQKAKIPGELLIAPGGFAVVPLDIFENSFDLAGSSGTLSLIDSVERGSCEVDAFDFDFEGVESGISLGRVPDGTGAPVPLGTPSPGESNVSDVPVVLFVRGDANGDGGINLTDSTAILGHLFQGSPIDCADAGDFNDNGDLDLADAIAVLDYLFNAGGIPPSETPVACS